MDINKTVMEGTSRHPDTITMSDETTTTTDAFTRRRPGTSRSKREPRSETRRRQRPSQDTDPPCRVRNGRVERRKRDRINTSLDDLMMLVPAAKINQQSPQNAKTDIIDLAVQHIKDLHGHVITEDLENDPRGNTQGIRVPASVKKKAEPGRPQGTDSPDGAIMPPAVNFLADLPPLDESGIVHTGFHDCTEQTIQYLIEVENLSMEDPVIIGLRQHLARKRLTLNCEDIVESDNLRTQEAERCKYLSKSNSGSSADVRIADDAESLPVGGIGLCVSRSDSYDEVDAPSDCRVSPNDKKNYNKSTANDTTDLNSFSLQGQCLSEDEPTEEDIDDIKLLEQLPNLAILGQSNPAIAQLAGQIMSMIEEEEDPVE